jgi:colicin import membrane protein
MAATLVIGNSDDLMGMRWNPMLVLSVVLHLVVFIIILFVPQTIPTRHIKGVVYKVDLVDMPAAENLKPQGATTARAKKGKTVAKRDSQARRIQGRKDQKKPLVIAKRTVKKKSSSIKKPKVSSTQLIDRAISRIEKKVQSGQDHIDKAISRLKSKTSGSPGSSSTGGRSLVGIPMRIYQMEVEGWIKSNWSYPVAVLDSKNPEAVVVVTAKNDGTILKSSFKKRSNDTVFDQSVLKAIEKSDPLPPFPEDYRRGYDEFEITFNLKDLEGH